MSEHIHTRFSPVVVLWCAFLPQTTLVGSVQETERAIAPILTPAAPLTPRINGPTIFGVRPDSPFLYAIPATGARPMTFSVEGLPEGLSLDAETGRITGALPTVGTYHIVLRAKSWWGRRSPSRQLWVGTVGIAGPMRWMRARFFVLREQW
jgi:alpha-galactosidase